MKTRTFQKTPFFLQTKCLFLICFFSVSFFGFHFSTVFGQTETTNSSDTILFVYQTESEHTSIAKLLDATGVPYYSIAENLYSGNAGDYRYLVTTSPIPLTDARENNITPFCIGAMPECTETAITFSEFNCRLSFTYGKFSQDNGYVRNFPIITSYTGEVFGDIRLSMNRSYPFAVKTADAYIVPSFIEGDLSTIMIMSALEDYTGKTKEEGSMYVMIDEIYPFSDLSMLTETAETFYEHGISFIVRIMPVYDNLDYPAFQRYTQVLRYIQSRNGSIVIHDPLEMPNEMVREPIEIKMTRFHAALTQNGLYWYEMDNPPIFITISAINAITTTSRNMGTFPADVVIRLTLPKDKEELDNFVDVVDSRWLTINDYKSKFSDRNFQFNETWIDENYTYVEKETVSFADFFAVSNRFLMIVVAISLLIFFGLLLIGVRYYRRKFYKPK